MDIKKDVVYVCTKGNKAGDIQKGELFWIDSRDNALVCPKAEGWLEQEEAVIVLNEIVFEKSNDYVVYDGKIVLKKKLLELLEK